MLNCNSVRGIICTAAPGQSIENFASELISLRKKDPGVIMAVFNDIPLFIHGGDTKQDIISQYYHRKEN